MPTCFAKARLPLRPGVAVTLAMACVPSHAEDAQGIEFFEKEVRPLLAEHCYECHSAEAKKLKANLYLDTRSGWETGGDSGPAIVPGKPEESLLIQAVAHTNPDLKKMPPKRALPDSDIETLRSWIAMGAPDPRDGESSKVASKIDLDEGRKFWSFQSPVAHPVPEVKDDKWPNSHLDNFILARLEAEGLNPAPDAPPLTLLRRTYYDLIGLPPSPRELEAFLADPSPAAYEAVVDDLLARPEFGERWGRHWLDVARFAESSGGGRSMVFPDAWRFRDYVIDSFNNDKPYDQFVREQIAGDLLPADSDEQRNDQLTGSGYLVLGPINYELQDHELLVLEVVDEQIDTVGKTFLGMTLGCARCHDHKFDPIPTTDYYALAGIFESTSSFGDGSAATGVSSFRTTKLHVPETDQLRKDRKSHAAITKEIASLQKLLKKPGKSGSIDPKLVTGTVIDNTEAALTGEWTSSTHTESWIGKDYIYNRKEQTKDLSIEFSTTLPESGDYEVLISYTPGSTRSTKTPVTVSHAEGEKTVLLDQSAAPTHQGCFASVGTFPFSKDSPARVTISSKDTTGYVIADAVCFVQPHLLKEQSASANKASKADLDALNKKKKALDKKLAAANQVAMAVSDSKSPADTHVRIRGQIRNLGEKVPRGFISVAMEPGSKPGIAPHSSGRLELADWITDPGNPLTSRVMVNRIWMHLLGEGIVRTPDNFGQTGALPSHPELLDHLTLQFMKEGWSVKKLIREIALSRTYQQSSRTTHDLDPENKLFGRAHRKPLEAECIRDTTLLVSGTLNPARGGLTIRNPGKYDLAYKFQTNRRSVYVPWFRNSVMDLFEIFDAANPNLVIGKRTTSNLPTQALFLMNSPFIREQSEHTAQQLIKDGATIDDAYLLILCRPPSDSERTTTTAFLEQFEDKEQAEAWTQLCQSLFSCLDFRFLD